MGRKPKTMNNTQNETKNQEKQHSIPPAPSSCADTVNTLVSRSLNLDHCLPHGSRSVQKDIVNGS